MDKKELAIALHDKKFNCCQAVACAFAEEVGVEEQVIFKACEGFGFGMGCMDGTCGALSGAIILAGFQNSDGNIADPGTKASTYQISRRMLEAFREKCGSTICRELKGVDTGKILCTCPDCICNGVEVVREVLGL